MRAFQAVGGTPVFVSRARGATLVDVDGNRYVDYVMSWGPLLHGHAPAGQARAIAAAVKRGTSFGAPTALEHTLGERVRALMPSMEMVRFVSSGTEAAMSAARVARAFTGRNRIVKFEGCYHGHADAFLVKAGSGATTFGAPTSPGVPAAVVADTLLARYNDLASVDALIARHPGQIAAVIPAVPEFAAPADAAAMAAMQAQYYGMISEVDAQLGRVWEHLQRTGQWENTVVVVTADHGEQMGDQGLKQKVGFYGSSYHIVGIVRDPARPATHGTVIERFTENIDVFPTLCDAMGIPVPAQCDGLPLTPLLRGEPPEWRTAAHYEWDWRDAYIPRREYRGRGTAVSSATTSPCSSGPTGRTCSSVTARGAASTWRPTRRGRPRSTTRPSSSPTPRRCSSGGRATSTARSPGCSCATVASDVARNPR